MIRTFREKYLYCRDHLIRYTTYPVNRILYACLSMCLLGVFVNGDSGQQKNPVPAILAGNQAKFMQFCRKDTEVRDPENIHPVHKQEVGERLALLALSCNYDRSG